MRQEVRKMDEKEIHQSGLSLKILQNCRNELYSFFPYLDGAFACLAAKPDSERASIATEGDTLWFSPRSEERRVGKECL